MAYMRIHCGDCGMVKEVHKYVPDDTEVRYCPLCGSEIDRDIWETMIIPAVELLNKANRAIIAKHTAKATTTGEVKSGCGKGCKCDKLIEVLKKKHILLDSEITYINA